MTSPVSGIEFVTAVALGGIALHAGCPSSVVFVRRPGPIAFRQRGIEVALRDLHIRRTDQGVMVESGALCVDLVEHLCAAIGGMGVSADLRVDVHGPEVPVLDGGAMAFARALRQLGFESRPPCTTILRSASFRVGEAEYRFSPSEVVGMSVKVVFDHPLIGVKEAEWCGDPDDFLERIAPARTFGFRRDGEALRAAGRARSIDPRAVVVLEEDGSSGAVPGPSPDECVRHKLLDLVGDVTLAVGISRGTIRAYRPGHAATHRVMVLACEAGVFG